MWRRPFVQNIMVPSALAMAVGMALLAASNSLVNAAPGLALWAIGHAMIGSSPTAYTCSVTSAKQRSQGVAVMRITGKPGPLRLGQMPRLHYAKQARISLATCL